MMEVGRKTDIRVQSYSSLVLAYKLHEKLSNIIDFEINKTDVHNLNGHP